VHCHDGVSIQIELAAGWDTLIYELMTSGGIKANNFWVNRQYIVRILRVGESGASEVHQMPVQGSA
jgi:hypothetical protein